VSQTQTILRSLEANAAEFKRLCEVKACSPDLEEDLDKALSAGAQLSVHIETVMSHLLDLKTRLESK
jgi:hypothetical protein